MYIVTFQQFIITHDSVFVPKLASPKSGFIVWVLLQKIIIRFRIVYALFFFLRLSFCYIPPQRSSPWVHGRNDLQLRKPAVNKFATEDPCLPDPKYQIFSYAHTYLSSFHHSSSLVTHSPLPCPISFSLFNLLYFPPHHSTVKYTFPSSSSSPPPSSPLLLIPPSKFFLLMNLPVWIYFCRWWHRLLLRVRPDPLLAQTSCDKVGQRGLARGWVGWYTCRRRSSSSNTLGQHLSRMSLQPTSCCAFLVYSIYAIIFFLFRSLGFFLYICVFFIIL